MAIMSAIVFRRSKQIPTVDRMVGPAAPSVCLFVDLNLASHGGEWHFVVVEWAVEVCIRRQLWIGVGLA